MPPEYVRKIISVLELHPPMWGSDCPAERKASCIVPESYGREYGREAPLAPRSQAVVLAIESTRKPEEEKASTSPPPPVTTSEQEPEPEPGKEVAARAVPIDLLGMDEPISDTSELDQKNALALAIVFQPEPRDGEPQGVPAGGRAADDDHPRP